VSSPRPKEAQMTNRRSNQSWFIFWQKANHPSPPRTSFRDLNIQKSVTDMLKTITLLAKVGTTKWEHLHRCVAAQGNYFEGDNIEKIKTLNKKSVSLLNLQTSYLRFIITKLFIMGRGKYQSTNNRKNGKILTEKWRDLWKKGIQKPNWDILTITDAFLIRRE